MPRVFLSYRVASAVNIFSVYYFGIKFGAQRLELIDEALVLVSNTRRWSLGWFSKHTYFRQRIGVFIILHLFSFLFLLEEKEKNRRECF